MRKVYRRNELGNIEWYYADELNKIEVDQYDEIERLTSELNDAEAIHKDLWCKVDTLNARIAKLEAAINKALIQVGGDVGYRLNESLKDTEEEPK